MDDVAPSPLAPATVTGPNGAGALLTADASPVAGAMLARLDVEHPVLSGRPARERLLAATWLAGYRSARTRRAYAGDLAAWLDWLGGVDVDAVHARRVHVDLWVRQLVDTGAAASSTSRRLSALSSFYRHLGEHDLITANPAAAVRRPTVDPDHTATVGLDRDQARAFIAAADNDTGPARLRTAATARLLLHLGLRVDELAAADVDDLGHDRGHRVLTVTRKGGRRAVVVLPHRPRPRSRRTSPTARAPRQARRSGRCWRPRAVAGSTKARCGSSCGVWPAPPASRPGRSCPRTRCATPRSPWPSFDAGAALRDVQDYAGHRDPHTTRRYDRARDTLDRNAADTLTAYLA